MKKKKSVKSVKDEMIVGSIFAIISFIVLLILGIVTKNYAILIILGIITVVLCILEIDMHLSRRKFSDEQKILKQHFESIKQQENISVFNECYLLAYEDSLSTSLFSAFKKNKVDGIRSIATNVVDKNSVLICCQYNSFEINIHIYEDHIDYRIFPPSRFDIIKSTKSFIEKRTAKISSKECYDIDSFLYQLSTLMSKIKDIVDEFIATNKVDNMFNGRLLHKFNYYWKNAKFDSVIEIICGPLMSIFMIFGFVFAILPDKEYQAENPIGLWIAAIFTVLLSILGIYAFVHGITELSRKHKFEKDFEERKYCKISGKPTKVKIYVEIPKGGNMYTKSMVLYFGKTKLFLPLEPRSVDKFKTVKKMQAECVKIRANIKYLETSKIIFDGASEYINIINRYSSKMFLL